MNLRDLQKEAHAIAKEHGWWDEERTFGDLIALVHSELSEALEAYRETGWPWLKVNEWRCDVHGKPMGVASELADVVIRVADMAEWYGVDLQTTYDIEEQGLGEWKPDTHLRTFGDWIARAHECLSDAMKPNIDRIRGRVTGFSEWTDLVVLVFLLEEMAAHYGIDLDAAIEAKMEYNRTREYRHGGKAL